MKKVYNELKFGTNAVLYEIMPGKPNREEKAAPTGEFRGRVVQKGQKGQTCWYYALNYIRTRIGPNHDPSLQKERDVEVFYSKIRKELTHFYNSLPKLCFALEDPASHMMKEWTQKTVEEMLHTVFSPLYVLDTAYSSTFGDHIKPFAEAFVKDPKGTASFYDYLQLLTMGDQEIYQTALNTLNIDSKKEFEEKIRPYFRNFISKSWEELPVHDRRVYLQGMLRASYATNLKLSYASWQPTHTIDSLIRSLKDHGPHFILGLYGQAFYKEFPYHYSTIGNRKMLGWKPGTRKTTTSCGSSHAIVLIGAEKGAKGELVYFLDPQDESDPNYPEGQRIYVMSYRSLCEHATDLMGNKIICQQQHPYPYAIHQ